jgi:hypothetical protein
MGVMEIVGPCGFIDRPCRLLVLPTGNATKLAKVSARQFLISLPGTAILEVAPKAQGRSFLKI